MKKAVIVALAAVNIGLLAAVVFVSGVPRAQGQAVLGTSDYLMVTGKVDVDTEAVYVIDLGTRKLAGFLVDRTTRRLKPFGARRLVMDFEQKFLDH